MDNLYYLKFLSAFVFVIALMFLISWAVKRFGFVNGGGMVKSKRRLNIVEQIFITPKQRLILLKRDDKEHLILIGTENSLLIESDIVSCLAETEIEDKGTQS